MKTYVIPRRHGWPSRTPSRRPKRARGASASRNWPDDVRWIRTYVVHEDDGSLGTFCIYQATGPDAMREHASLARMPADEILEIAITNVVRPDPDRAPA